MDAARYMHVATSILFLQIIALLAFTTTVGFSSSSSNRVDCMGFNATKRTAIITFSYPYIPGDFRATYIPDDNFIQAKCTASFSHKTFSSSAQYFVGMGVLSMLYNIAAIIIYILFVTPKLWWLILGVSF